MDLVSVIIPVYNVERYLRECLQSVIGQTYKKLEILLCACYNRKSRLGKGVSKDVVLSAGRGKAKRIS